MLDAKTARAEAIEHNTSLKTLLSDFETHIGEAVNHGSFQAHVYLSKKTSTDMLNDVISVLRQKGYDIVHDYATVPAKNSFKLEHIHHCLVSW